VLGTWLDTWDRRRKLILCNLALALLRSFHSPPAPPRGPWEVPRHSCYSSASRRINLPEPNQAFDCSE
jgi:hypothetical protein